MTSRLYKCRACRIGFGIQWPMSQRRSNKAIRVACPLCHKQDDIQELAPIREAGGHIASKLLEWWKNLPAGDD